MPPHYIAVEGPIGVGKTTVVEKLAERLDANKVLEDWATNPFLQPFYEGSDGASFQLELFFLLMRYRQQQELVQRQLFAQATLCDYVFEKSRLFAYLNLDDSELMIYEKLFTLLAESAPRPDLVVYLRVPRDVAVTRLTRSLDRIEQEDEFFHRRVSAAFDELAAQDDERWLVVDGSGTVDEVAAEVWRRLESELAAFP